MTRATFRFFAELNDFLPQHHRQQPCLYDIPGRPSVKDAIEAQGVPHTEVALVRLNGDVCQFGALIDDGDHFDVYPPFTGINPDSLTNPYACNPPEPIRFIADIHLGKLAASLRMLGFDTTYGVEADEDLAAQSSDEKRILLTRDLGLLKRSQVQYGYYPRATDPKKQVVEVLNRYRLLDAIRPFQRCSRCNGTIQAVPKASIQSLVPKGVYTAQNDFHQCQRCQQVYWKGSHYDRLENWISNLVEAIEAIEAPSDPPSAESFTHAKEP